MNRLKFQKLAELRLEEAGSLLNSGYYSGAYYLCGYVIECALKACIAKQTKEHDFPPKNVNKIYTHNLENLIENVGLKEDIKKDDILLKNWTLVKDWTEESRYKIVDKNSARDLFAAVTNENKGILGWLKQHW